MIPSSYPSCVKLLLAFILMAQLLLISGCATIVRDDSQPVSFSSDPQGAIVKLDGISGGITPTTIQVKRKIKATVISFEKEGFHTESFPLDKSLSAMTFGNVIFGGIIGLGVDAMTGKNTNYPESVHVRLIPDRKGEDPFIDGAQDPPDGSVVSETDLRRKAMQDYNNGAISAAEYLQMLSTIQ
mgnify:CR=1 FL=1